MESGRFTIKNSGFRQQKDASANTGHMGASIVMMAYPRHQFRILFKNFLNICSRGDKNQIRLENILNAAMRLDIDIIHGPDGLSVCRHDCYVKKRCLWGFSHTIPQPPRLVKNIHGSKNGCCHGVVRCKDSNFLHRFLPDFKEWRHRLL